MAKILSIFFLLLAWTTTNTYAQFATPDLMEIEEDDLNVGADIFSDFNEDLESVQVVEDERFFQYGRFFTFAISVGNTSFTGNRGDAYANEPPSWGISVSYFQNFRVAFVLGLEYSEHNMVINGPTSGYTSTPGLIEINMLRPYFGFRYYLDTSNLGTALTFANPYLTARMEYWYQKNNFEEETIASESGGGFGLGLGAGLEFPIVLREYYLGIEVLYHPVNFFDKYTTNFREDPNAPADNPSQETFQDLTGNALSFMVSYVINW